MFSEKSIVITIGNYGAVVAFHEGDAIKDKVFLDELNDTSKAELKNLFAKHKSSPISVLLDTIDQSYKKKVYPSVRKGDLIRLIKRDMANDVDKESLKNYIILNTKKTAKSKKPSGNRWECLFVSSSNSELVSQWIEFLPTLPNRMVGIYMLPVEAFNLFKKLKHHVKTQSKVKNKKNDLYCLVMQNKASGIRQIVFSDQGIVFTRVVNYDFKQTDFLEKYEQDIYSTFEYLKRLFPDVSITELDIINILPSEALNAIKNLNNVELNLVNYTPYQAAQQTGNGKILQEGSSSCDLLISKVFSKEKKILKFTTSKISSVEKFYYILQTSYYLNLFLFVAVCFVGVSTIFSQDKINEVVDAAETAKFTALSDLQKLQQSALDGTKLGDSDKEVDIDKAVDFGKMEEIFGSKTGVNFMDFYTQLRFLKEFNVKLGGFSYSLSGFNGKSPSQNTGYKFSFTGNMSNKSGDIEDLFKEFDNLTVEVKKIMGKDQQIKYSELPRNIDFNQKYYSFPIDFTISK